MYAKYSLPPFDWLKLSHHLVSGESTLHEVTLFEARSGIFLPTAESCAALFCCRLAIWASSLGWLVGNKRRKKTEENNSYRKIPKISPGAYIFQRPFSRGLFFELLIFGGKFVCLIVERKFALFALFYFVFEGNFQVQAPPGGGGGLYLERLIYGGASVTNGILR